MARYNIKLNYEELKKLSESCLNLAVSLGDIETAIKNMDDAVGNCSGKAAEALYGKGAEIVSNMGDLGIGLTKFSVNIANYSNDMKAIIDAAGSGMLHINTVDVSWNLRQMISDLLEFDSFARGVNPKGNVNALSLGASPNYDSDEDKMLMNQLSGKLDNIKELLVAAANDLANYDEDFEKFKNIISEFENKDDEYRDILQEVYYEISDTGFWGKTSTKVIIGVTLIVVAAAIVFLAPILAGVGGVVGACAAAIAGCAWLTAIATEVIAVGLFTGVLAGGIAVFTGNDIEDAVGGGLFEGTVSSVITGGLGQVASSTKYLSYGTKALSKTPLKNNAAAKETVEFVMEEGMEYVGEIASSTFLKLYNGEDVNIAKISTDAAFDRGLSNVFKGIGNYVNDNLNTDDVNLIRDGKLSLNDLKNAISNGFNNKSVSALKEVSSQAGHDAIDNFYTNVEEEQNSAKEDLQIEVNPTEVTDSVIKKDIKGKALDGVKQVIENSAEKVTGSSGGE